MGATAAMWAQRFAITLLAMSIVSAPAFAQTAAQPSAGETWLAVSINGQPAGDVALFVREADGHLFTTAEKLRSWRLRVPAESTLTQNGEQYFALDALPGLSYQIDDDEQLLKINAPANLFDRISIGASRAEYERAAAPPLGGFLNYDVVGTRTDGNGALNGLVEASVFGSAGAGFVRYLARHAESSTDSVRLESTWTHDRPEAISSFRLGDSITGASRWWGGAVRFGGVQWASNYATRPGLVTLPLPSVLGESAVPTTFDLYVNDALRTRNSVPGGPFSVENIPVVTGEGQIRLVMRDALGREQTITEPYYASPRLLRAGLHDYSIDAGFIRENYGIASNDYGQPLVVGTDRFGLTDELTTEVHGELLREQQTVGVSGALLLSSFGVLSVSAAGSRATQGSGYLVGLGFERSAQQFGFGATAELSSDAFARIGMQADEAAPRLKSQLYATAALGHFGSIGISRTQQDFHDGRRIEILSARDSVNVGNAGYLSLTFLRVRAATSDTVIALSFTRSLNPRTSASASATSMAQGTDTQLQIQKNLPTGRGIGYRVGASAGIATSFDSTLSLRNDVGTYELEVQRQGGRSLTLASMSGGVAAMDGRLFAGQRIESSFAVAHVGEEPGVRVYRENQLIGRTDERGYLLLPGLRPYDANLIRVEQADLPLDVPIDTMEVDAVPRFRSGMLLDFRVERPRGALLEIVLENGQPLPAGALVSTAAQSEQFPSGLRGEVYVTGLESNNQIRAEWTGHHCEFTMPYAQTDDPLPRLGPFVCKSATP
jgi:outer membrane usher protein